MLSEPLLLGILFDVMLSLDPDVFQTGWKKADRVAFIFL